MEGENDGRKHTNTQTKMKATRMMALMVLLMIGVAVPAKNFIQVKAGDSESLLAAIDEANRLNADSARVQWLFILIPNGTYDLGDRVLTTITGHRVALIGQSMRGTVIVNRPAVENEGIQKTATLRLMTSDTYLQDLTLKNALDYYHAGAAGRAVALHDKGVRTICNRVCLLSYQDTFYSDNELSQMYLEGSEIHGTVDFICGSGDVCFNGCTVVTEPRQLDGHGRNVIAAPRTANTAWGYVFLGCTIYNRQSEFQYARGWHTHPRCAWLNTTLMTPEKLKEPRFDPAGMRTVNSDFWEYHTTDAQGRDITPQSNVVTFTLREESRAAETIMTKREAQRYEPKKIFPDWRPEKILDRLERKAAQLKRHL